MLRVFTAFSGCDFDNAHNSFADISATEKCYWELKNRGLI